MGFGVDYAYGFEVANIFPVRRAEFEVKGSGNGDSGGRRESEGRMLHFWPCFSRKDG